MLHHTVTHETAAAHGTLSRLTLNDMLILQLEVTLHNLAFQARVMGQARDAIMSDTFPTYLRTFFAGYFDDVGYPEWCVNALRTVGVDLMEGNPNAKVVKGDGAKWEYSNGT